MRDKFKPYNVKALTDNYKRILRHKDINKLNKPLYNFIILYCSFIAHYDLHGFRSTYEQPQDFYSFVKRISEVFDIDRYIRDDYFIKEYGEEYCNSQVETLNNLVELSKQFIEETELKEETKLVSIKTYSF